MDRTSGAVLSDNRMNAAFITIGGLCVSRKCSGTKEQVSISLQIMPCGCSGIYYMESRRYIYWTAR